MSQCSTGNKPAIEKKQMSNGGIIAIIVLLSMAAPLATDLYLPAITEMPAFFHASESVVNLTLISFYAFMAIGMLVFGPLSDRWGRKPAALLSLGLFIFFALLGSTISNVWILIFARILQGLGGGGMVAVGTALVKDCFEGETRQRVLVVAQIAGVLAPMLAPILGTAILSFTTWRGTMVAQALIAMVPFFLLFRLVEPLAPEDRVHESLLKNFGRLVVVAKNPSFIILMLVVGLGLGPYMTYVSAATYIYTVQFNLAKFTYSIIFALNSLLVSGAALLVVALAGKVSRKKQILGAFVCQIVSGLSTVLIGAISPLTFFISYGIFTAVTGFVRPIITDVLLEQQEKDTGSASALINFTVVVFGALSMPFATMNWPSYTFGVGTCVLVCGTATFIGILLLLKSRIPIKNFK